MLMLLLSICDSSHVHFKTWDTLFDDARSQ